MITRKKSTAPCIVCRGECVLHSAVITGGDMEPVEFLNVGNEADDPPYISIAVHGDGSLEVRFCCSDECLQVLDRGSIMGALLPA